MSDLEVLGDRLTEKKLAETAIKNCGVKEKLM